MFESYLRIAAKFKVDFAKEPHTIITLEGPVQCQAGDAIITGVIGERWAVQRSIFDQNYCPVDQHLPQGIDGFYLRKEISVQAEKIKNPHTVDLGENRGVLNACVGDWLVVSSEGRQWVIADKVFTKTYIKLDHTKEHGK